jgi:hypothetical protein
MDGYAKKMEESSVSNLRIQLKKVCHKQTNKDFNTMKQKNRDNPERSLSFTKRCIIY